MEAPASPIPYYRRQPRAGARRLAGVPGQRREREEPRERQLQAVLVVLQRFLLQVLFVHLLPLAAQPVIRGAIIIRVI